MDLVYRVSRLDVQVDFGIASWIEIGRGQAALFTRAAGGVEGVQHPLPVSRHGVPYSRDASGCGRGPAGCGAAGGRSPRAFGGSENPEDGSKSNQKVAIGLMGEPVPPVTGRGEAVSRNSQRFRLFASSLSFSRS